MSTQLIQVYFIVLQLGFFFFFSKSLLATNMAFNTICDSEFNSIRHGRLPTVGCGAFTLR